MNREESSGVANPRTTASRLTFFDNLRYLMVLLVLVFHSGASYGSAVAFWPFHDANPSRIIDIFMFLLDMFMMPVLFFIAGFFALQSLQKKGSLRFITCKLKRLGIPWLAVIVFVLPLLDYIHYYVKTAGSGLQAGSYAAHWLLSMKKIVEFSTGWMDMSSYLNMTEHFYQRYMWFISLLLLFFVIFALLYRLKEKCEAGQSIRDEEKSNKPVFAALFLVGFLTVLLFAILKFFMYSDFLDKGWFSLGNIFQFQLGKMVIFASYFGLGIFAYSKKWFTDGLDFGRPWVWGLVCFLLFIANMMVLMKMKGADKSLLFLKTAFVVLYPVWTLSFLGVFTAFASRHWNRSTPFNRELAANSYNMYLVHYIFPMTFPLFLSVWEGGPVPVKFGIVALATVLLSYGISRYVIKPFPRLVLAGLIILSILLALLM